MATEFDTVMGDVPGNATSHSLELAVMIRRGGKGWLLAEGLPMAGLKEKRSRELGRRTGRKSGLEFKAER